MHHHHSTTTPRGAAVVLAAFITGIACDAVEDADEPDRLDGATDLLSPIDPQAAIAVQNPGFELPWSVPAGDPATTLAPCTFPPGSFGLSASKRWTTYANTARTSINSWIADAPTYPAVGPSAPSNLAAVGGGQDGLVQVLADQCTSTDVNRVNAWVYVIAGEVALQIGNGGAGGGAWELSTTHGEWEEIHACGRPDTWNNEITLYGTGPAVFYVDDVSVDFSADCPSCAHSSRDEGAPLSEDCGACEARVCAAHGSCCETWWDELCVAKAIALCPDECPL